MKLIVASTLHEWIAKTMSLSIAQITEQKKRIWLKAQFLEGFYEEQLTIIRRAMNKLQNQQKPSN